jgi:hypothetical protein
VNADEAEYLIDCPEEDRARRLEIIRLIRWVFGPEHADRAIKIARTVSDLQPLVCHRYSPEGVGLFDIDPHLVGLAQDQAWILHNPIRNTNYAYKLFLSSGWRYWEEAKVMATLPEFHQHEG